MSAGMINGASRERIGKAVPTGEELKGAVAIGKDRIRYIVGWIHPDVQPPSLPELFDAGGCIGYGESSKEVGAFQHGPPDIKHHGWFAGAVLVALHCFRCNRCFRRFRSHIPGGAMPREINPEASGRQLIRLT